MKIKKECPIVNTAWIDVSNPEYELRIECPNKKCKRSFFDFELYDEDYAKISEGEKINRIIMCPHCTTKFRLKVKAV